MHCNYCTGVNKHEAYYLCVDYSVFECFLVSAETLRGTIWAPQEPRYGKGDCSFMELKGESLIWMATPCDITKSHFLCQKCKQAPINTK